MSIIKITQKEYKKAMHQRKVYGKSFKDTHLYFKGALGGYYKCTEVGLAGSRQIAEFQKDQHSHLTTQLTIL